MKQLENLQNINFKINNNHSNRLIMIFQKNKLNKEKNYHGKINNRIMEINLIVKIFILNQLKPSKYLKTGILIEILMINIKRKFRFKMLL